MELHQDFENLAFESIDSYTEFQKIFLNFVLDKTLVPELMYWPTQYIKLNEYLLILHLSKT